MYRLKSEVVPSFALVLLGTLDCITTMIGVLYFGASELNPFLSGIVSKSIWAFLALKLSATFFIGFTYIMAKRTLSRSLNKQTRAFRFSSRLMKVAYAGLVVFLVVVVTNNLIILLA